MKKRNLLIIMILCFAIFKTGNLFAYSGGQGTTNDPYKIANIANLIELSNTSDDWSAHFIQTADIVFYENEGNVDWDGDGTANWDPEDQKGFSPIGNNSRKFTGSYDGQGYTISNLFIDRSSTPHIALFGLVQNGVTIENLGVISCNLTGGAIVGGLIAEINNSVTVKNCYSTGSINGGNSVGGLIGMTYLGCSINSCYTTVEVNGSTTAIGGFVGYHRDTSTIKNSYSTGNVNGSGTAQRVGGFVGLNSSSTIEKCYSSGSVSGDQNIGGFVGLTSGATTNDCFWNTTTSGIYSSAGGTGKTNSEMQDIATFTDTNTEGLDNAWDFVGDPNDDWYGDDDYWNIDSDLNGDYPYLVWQYVSAPTVSNLAATNIDATSATLNGEVTDTGGEDPTVTIYWGDNDGGTNTGSWDYSINKGTQSGTFSSTISNLDPNTTYYYRCYAENSAGSDWANATQNFTTLKLPVVTTDNISNIGLNTATANGNIDDLGNPNPTQHGHCWSTSTNPDLNDNKTTLGSASTTGAFDSDITGLSPGQIYYVRAYATNDVGTSYGSEKSFTTLTPGLWTGGTSSDWNTASNWNDGNVPTSTVDVTIPSGCSNYPTIDEAAVCQNFTIENGGEININTSYTLEINGDFTLNDGSSFSNSGTLKFSGTSKTLNDNRSSKISLGNIQVGN